MERKGEVGIMVNECPPPKIMSNINLWPGRNQILSDIMGLKLKVTGVLMMAMALTTTVVAIDQLNGITYWDVAAMTGHDKWQIGDYHPVPWRFESNDADAHSGIMEAQGFWVGTWNEVGPCTIYCEMTSANDEWYLTFVNPEYFIAYKDDNSLYRFGHIKGTAAQSIE